MDLLCLRIYDNKKKKRFFVRITPLYECER